jgi:hypothetical protein
VTEGREEREKRESHRKKESQKRIGKGDKDKVIKGNLSPGCGVWRVWTERRNDQQNLRNDGSTGGQVTVLVLTLRLEHNISSRPGLASRQKSIGMGNKRITGRIIQGNISSKLRKVATRAR